MMPIVRPDAGTGLDSIRRRMPRRICAATAGLILLGLLSACAEQPHGDYASGNAMRAHLLARFKQADTNGDEQLTREEMTKGMPELAPHFDEIDLDHNQRVNFAELWSYMQLRAFAANDARAHSRY
ncbi:MAG: EF-hand domain-containing protein [Stenotrophobium sp.]